MARKTLNQSVRTFYAVGVVEISTMIHDKLMPDRWRISERLLCRLPCGVLCSRCGQVNSHRLHPLWSVDFGEPCRFLAV